jgi:hypothetical protein
MNTHCTISTPQHKDGKVYRFHKQSGTFDFGTLLFTPYRGQGVGGDHCVQFSSIAQFRASEHAATATKLQYVWWPRLRPHFGFIKGDPHKTPAAFHLCYRWSLWLGWLEVRCWLSPVESIAAVAEYLKPKNTISHGSNT